jgi:hypothetical protein
MGNRYLFRDQGAYYRGLVDVNVIANIGGTGAISSTVPAAARGYTISRSTTGTYVVTFTDSYPYLLDVSADVTLVSGTPGAGNPYWATPGPWNATTRQLTVYIWNPGGTALVDPASGATLYVTAIFANTTVP